MDKKDFNLKLLPYQAKMFRFARSLISPQEEAEDVVQDVYLKLWNNRQSLRKIQNLESYIMRAVKNTALNKLNKMGRIWEELEGSQDIQDFNTPETWTELNDTKKLIAMIVDRLPPRQRSIFRLREIEYYEIEAIAKLLELDPNNVKVNLSIARKKVKETFYKIVRHEV